MFSALIRFGNRVLLRAQCDLLPGRYLLSSNSFVNYPSKKPAGRKLFFEKIVFSKRVTKNCDIFVSGNVEAAIKLIMVHKPILTNLKIADQVKGNRAFLSIKK